MVFSPKSPLLKPFQVLVLAWFVSAGLLAAPTAQELADQGRQAESQGYLSLAAHYYYHALKAAPGEKSLGEALARVMEKRRAQRLEASVAKAAEPGPKSEIPLAKGAGAWVQGEARAAAKSINDYNLAAPRAQRVKYVFPESGTLAISGGRVNLAFSPDYALILGDTLLGEGRVYPLLKGPSQGAEGVSQAEWARAAKELADKFASEDRFSGLLLALEPMSPALLPFYAELRKAMAKPTGLALSVWDKALFRYADFIVLRADPSPSAARDQIHGFLADARAESGKALVALPDDAPSFKSGRLAIGQAMEDDDPSLLGPALTFPAEPALLDLLKLPLERP